MELYPSPENRLPPGAACHELVTADGVQLRAMSAVPKNAKGTVVFLNGRADYMERYFETLSDLIKKGYAVAALDWRGQGGSQRLLENPNRGYIKSFANYDADLEALMGQVVIKLCPKPFYGLAHSTGGHIMLRALREKIWFKKVVISAPLLGFHFGAWPLGVVRLLNLLTKLSGLSFLYLPGFNQNPMLRRAFANNPLTSNKARWTRDLNTLNANPKLSVGGPTYGWLRAAMASLAELHSWPRSKGPTCPTLIVMAGKDRVVNNADTRRFVSNAPGFALTTITDSLHEILMEDNEIRLRFFAAFDAFIET
ncbi:MAG: alpha/beta hydrolase [Alphaproteobacteria bacterium]|nr:alpha/beta hydrolase [Alphaproteobacteria bacterium]